MDYLFYNATIVTMNFKREIIHGGAIAIEKDRIIDIGLTSELITKYDNAMNKVDLMGKCIFPGLINTHVHSFQTLLKGLGTDTTLEHWLNKVITPSVTSLEESDMYHGAVLSALDAVRSGTTTILDYQYVQYKSNLNEASIKGYNDIGMRLFCARGFADTGVEFGANPGELESLDTIKVETLKLVEKFHKNDSDMVRIALAPSAIWMCTPECLKWVSEFSEEHNLLVTAHISETPYDNECSTTLHGCGDYEACENYGLINERMIMVHCVQMTEKEIKRAKSKGACFSYNPLSNMFLASGAAPIREMNECKIIGSLGTDGAASNNTNDLIETIKAGVLLAKVNYRDPLVFTAYDALEYATLMGATALGMEKDIGSLEIGKKADFFVYNPYLSAKSIPCHDPIASLVYASDPRNVESVFIDGKAVLWEGSFTMVDEDALVKEADLAAKLMVEKINYYDLYQTIFS